MAPWKGARDPGQVRRAEPSPVPLLCLQLHKSKRLDRDRRGIWKNEIYGIS